MPTFGLAGPDEAIVGPSSAGNSSQPSPSLASPSLPSTTASSTVPIVSRRHLLDSKSSSADPRDQRRDAPEPQQAMSDQQDQQQQDQQRASQEPGQPIHKRVYQACIPCRRRKVKCDMGSVDNPHDPPCMRCRRESKQCFFSATRRKRKNGNESDNDDYVERNGRRRLNSIDGGDDDEDLESSGFNRKPLAPNRNRASRLSAGRIGKDGVVRTRPLQRPNTFSGASGGRDSSLPNADEPNTPLENLEARTVMRREVYGPHDALDLLYKAATDGPQSKMDISRSKSTGPSQDFGTSQGATQGTVHASRHHDFDRHSGPSRSARGSGSAQKAVDQDVQQPDMTAEPGYADAIRLWGRFRFVRAGWFTAQEAIDYIAYYYKYLSPLTPISPPTFNNPTSHVTLLNEEPILAVTLLTIASRYKAVTGPGASSRSSAIHEQLWTYLRGMIERVIWGQEAFGGGFCGSGADDSSTAPWRGLRKGSLRTLGTIESLLILTEWHPRALHFPPADVTDELLLPASAGPGPLGQNGVGVEGGEGGDQLPKGVGGKRIDGWLEPAWRSDRMCWMLLSAAMGLGYELGIFDEIDEYLASGAIPRPEYEEETYRHRAVRIKRLLLIYVTQLAGRLGWTSMIPESLRKRDPATRKRPLSSVEGGQTPGTTLSTASNAFNYIPDLELDDQIIHCWVGISNAMHAGNERLFCTRAHTTDIIQSGKYIDVLKDFQPMLRDWWKEFERFKLPTYTRYILMIEYEYVRIYVNSLSLQAVVERCTNNAGSVNGSNSNGNNNNMPAAPQQLSPQTQNYYGQLPLGQVGGFGVADQEYVREVVDGCRNLLRTVVDGLLPGGYLKHAPVRTYFRIISGAMFLLKTFALGAPRVDVEVSITLMDRTVDALRNCVVDDVHLGIRFADLLESLTSRLRNRFIHAPSMPPSTAAAASADGKSPNPLNLDTAGPMAVDGPILSAAGNGAAANAAHAIGNMNANAVANGNGAIPSAAVHPISTATDSWTRNGMAGLGRTSTLANISATPFDPAAGSFPFTTGPGPTLGAPSTPGATATVGGLTESVFGADGNDWNTNDMWYLPAGAAFFQNMGDSNVAMTAEGISVAGMDMLDFMTMDPPVFPQNMDSGSNGNNANGF